MVLSLTISRSYARAFSVQTVQVSERLSDCWRILVNEWTKLRFEQWKALYKLLNSDEYSNGNSWTDLDEHRNGFNLH